MSFQIKNFSIGEFNNDVNHSGDLDDKYLEWSEYRNGIKDFISRTAGQDPETKSITVFGAGECNDLDLNFLARTFNRVLLTDVDKKSIFEGIKRQGLNEGEKSKIEVEEVEYTGLSEIRFFEVFAKMVSEGSQIEKVIAHIEESIEKLDLKTGFNKELKDFDIVLSCPIYTQLVYTQAEVLFKILKQFGAYRTEEIDILLDKIDKVMPIILSRYNDFLISMVKKEGIIVLLTDVVEIPKNDVMIPQIKNRLSKSMFDEEELEQFVETYGLNLAKIGYGDLLDKVVKQSTFWSLWPFDEYKEYLVLGIAGKRI